jgi:hypothetical protein
MRLIRYVGFAALAAILGLVAVKGYSISHRPTPSVTPQGANCTNGKSSELNSQDRKPKCCGQCTASDGKAGCTVTIKNPDGTTSTGCSSCG